MIDTVSLRSHIEEHPDQWHTVADLAEAIGTADLSSVRNELSNLWIQHMKSGDWSHLVDHSEPMVIMRPDADGNRYRYAPGMDAVAWQTVMAARVTQAVAVEQRSQSRYWLDEAGKALAELRNIYQGG